MLEDEPLIQDDNNGEEDNFSFDIELTAGHTYYLSAESNESFEFQATVRIEKLSLGPIIDGGSDIISFVETDEESAGTESGSARSSGNNTASASARANLPKTGDGADLGLWIVMGILGFIGLIVFAGKPRRNRKM